MYFSLRNKLCNTVIKFIAGSADGADKLNRAFSYDPLYRLLSATGRESDTQEQNDYLYADAPIPGSPNANHVRAYATSPSLPNKILRCIVIYC
jgi:hypothetical protein